MIKVGILGAAGYTGGELIRILVNHPEADIVFANSVMQETTWQRCMKDCMATAT